MISESSCLNQEPILFEGVSTDIDIPIKLTGDGLELSVLKKAEKEDQLIIRVIETHGRSSSGSLYLDGTITECDLMEWNNIDTPLEIDGKYEITLSPFEIRTYKVDL